MSPGGHLVTTAVAGGVALAATGSVSLAAGIAVGGFLIDVDHAVDYVTIERRREITPAAFLRYYTAARARRVVLALHSYELFLALAVLAWWLDSAWLAGYLAGGAMHLALDIVFNGRLTPKNIFAFYRRAFGVRSFSAPVSRALAWGAGPPSPSSPAGSSPAAEVILE
ncbi:MAG: hypothetical protein HYU25_14285 [Candidatus Rokubacteria bacterium]|nr:hypothetical protein [Candidatus Rokubacteria bacterium]